MSEASLNETFFPEGTCIGCGLANPKGFHARFYRDQEGQPRVLGRFVVPDHAAGLPGLVQGGVLFTVLDCLNAWTLFGLRPNRPVMPVSLSASIQYHRPGRIGQELRLVGTIAHDGNGPGDPTIVHGELRDPEDQLLCDMDSKLALFSLAKFKKVMGLVELPEHYKRLFPGED
jgi:acyl-coenzyme A thioesterase PaaI-like protein